MIALCHRQLYQRRLKKEFDKKVCPRDFEEGDLVPKKIFPIQKDFSGKWTPNYERSYVVKNAFSSGDLVLAMMDGEEFSLLIALMQEKVSCIENQ